MGTGASNVLLSLCVFEVFPSEERKKDWESPHVSRDERPWPHDPWKLLDPEICGGKSRKKDKGLSADKLLRPCEPLAD